MNYREALEELRRLRDREREVRAAVTEEEARWLTLALYQDVLLEAHARGRSPKTPGCYTGPLNLRRDGMSYEIRRNALNRFELREKPTTKKLAGAVVGGGQAPLLGVFDSTEAAAQFALQHAQGAFEWKPFDPQGDIDARRKQLEGNLRA